MRHAARNGHLDIVRFLVEAGGSKDQARKEGTTPLFVAAEDGHFEIVRFLVACGAVKDKANDDWMSPLWIAAAEGHLDTVSVLVEAGQQESLHIAAAGGYLDVVRLLLESGADVDLITKDGQTARDLALMNGHHKLVDELGTKRPLFVCR